MQAAKTVRILGQVRRGQTCFRTFRPIWKRPAAGWSRMTPHAFPEA
jgi:hypothetical protein